MVKLETEYLRKGLGNIYKELRDTRKMLDAFEDEQRQYQKFSFWLSVAIFSALVVIAYLLFEISTLLNSTT
jgi:hypothetical protein